MSNEVAEIDRAVDGLPDGWRNVRVGDVSRSFAGGTPSRSNPAFYGPGIPWLKSGEVRAGRISAVEEEITEAGLRESSARIAKAGSPVIAMYGATAGVAGILEIDAALNQAVLAMEPVATTLNSEFCFYLLSSEAPRLLTMTQGSGQPNLSKGLIDGLNVALPPLAEQRRIAEVLRSVDEVIAAKQAALEHARHVLSIVREALVEPRGSDVDQVPDGWQRGKLGDIITLEYGRSLPDKVRRAGAVPVYGSNGVVGWHDEPLVQSGGIVVGRKGTAGSVTVSTQPFWPIDTTYFVKERQQVDEDWLTAVLHHSRLNELNEATGVPGLNRDKAYRQPVLLPPLAEQRRIAEVLRGMQEGVNLAKADLESTSSLKVAVMSDLLSGHVRVPE